MSIARRSVLYLHGGTFTRHCRCPLNAPAYQFSIRFHRAGARSYRFEAGLASLGTGSTTAIPRRRTAIDERSRAHLSLRDRRGESKQGGPVPPTGKGNSRRATLQELLLKGPLEPRRSPRSRSRGRSSLCSTASARRDATISRRWRFGWAKKDSNLQPTD